MPSATSPWVVLKYGGTSVATAKTWASIVARVKTLLPSNRAWVVVSALSQVTNALLRCIDEVTTPGLTAEAQFKSFHWIAEAHAKIGRDMGLPAVDMAPVNNLLDELKRLLDGILLTQEVSPRLRARIAAFGELLSSQVGVAYLRSQGVDAIRVDSRSMLTSDVGVGDKAVSEADMYLEANVVPSTQVDRANAAAQGHECVICQGFIASTPAGATCLLGRGGSDTSGALFAALVGAQRLEIWTDVNGMFTADPRFVPAARLIRSLTYREAQELAAMGAKVLHPRCLLPAAFAGIPVEVRNTMDPGDDAEITVVSTSGLDYLKRTGEGGDGKDGAAISVTVEGGRPSSPSLGFHIGGGWRSDTPSPTHATTLDGTGATAGAAALPAASTGGSRIIFAMSPTTTSGGVGGFGVIGGGGSHGALHALPTSSSFSSLTGAATGAGSDGGGGVGGSGGASASPSSHVWTRAPMPKVLAVARRKGVTLVNLSTFDMWQSSGFLAKVFSPFATHGVSVDLIATSQYAVSLTLDHIPEGVYGDTFHRVTTALGKICATSVRYPCAVVSVVGRSLRNALPKLGAAMKVLHGVPVHMVSEASEDLNLSFVVDEEHADRLVALLHQQLLESDDIATDNQFGPVWTDMPCGKASA